MGKCGSNSSTDRNQKEDGLFETQSGFSDVSLNGNLPEASKGEIQGHRGTDAVSSHVFNEQVVSNDHAKRLKCNWNSHYIKMVVALLAFSVLCVYIFSVNNLIQMFRLQRNITNNHDSIKAEIKLIAKLFKIRLGEIEKIQLEEEDLAQQLNILKIQAALFNESAMASFLNLKSTVFKDMSALRLSGEKSKLRSKSLSHTLPSLSNAMEKLDTETGKVQRQLNVVRTNQGITGNMISSIEAKVDKVQSQNAEVRKSESRIEQQAKITSGNMESRITKLNEATLKHMNSLKSTANKMSRELSSLSTSQKLHEFKKGCPDYEGGDLALVNSVVRLVGGSQSAGRVEVFHNQEWGTICGENWDTRDGNVICRMLGYGIAITAPRWSRFGKGTGRIWLSHVFCGGAEPNISYCGNMNWGRIDSKCNHDNDASVACSYKSKKSKSLM